MLPQDWQVFVLGLFCGIVLTAASVCLYKLIAPWLRSVRARGHVGLIHVLRMQLKGRPVALLVDAHLLLLEGSVNISMYHIERVYLEHENHVSTSKELVYYFLAHGDPDKKKQTKPQLRF